MEQKASLTVEAALAISVFLFAVFGLLGFFGADTEQYGGGFS